ncbi:tetratricopeptide repeat protein [Thermomicrobium sp. CFH 73360]|uniref:tetratricopeptide repeat protein n=1 Tax=Thermomicrobium sp. CFH 73360 TaxID=2951987 RepID=UPI0020776A32|nr:tetratricopeptide repeat protein [Thermomicrobium sp. CFH 73360]MCM8746164.1 tetratricopeptide repeat protein [Thermomicrobium sp. CFH 73360]
MSTIPLAEAVTRAETALEQGRLEDARLLVEVMRRVAPEAVSTQRLWGWLLLRRGEFVAAEEILGHVVQVNPEDARAWALLAESRRTRGEREEARALLQVAWECAPWQRTYAQRLAEWFAEDGIEGQLFPSAACLASWYIVQGWWARASEECRAALEQLGERWDVRQRLCLALWWGGARREAVGEAERILSVHPEMIGALVVAALSARDRGDEGEARRHRELLCELDPVGEVIERSVPMERWEERAWLALPEPIVVEEHWLVAPLGETELLWELPSEEELEAARPSSVVPEEEAPILKEIERALSGVVDGNEGGGETIQLIGEAAWGEEHEFAGLRAELDVGWTGLSEEWGTAVEEGPEESGEVPSEEELSGVVSGWGEERTEEKVVGASGEAVSAGGMSETSGGGESVGWGTGEEVGGAREDEGTESETVSAAENRGDEEVERVRELLARGEVREAVRRAQVMVYQGSAVDELIPVLERIVAEGGAGARQAAMTLGAIYRRRGEGGLAARYYELALRVRSE